MIRGQMVGLSSAFGKAGAAIGVVAFGAIQDRLGEDVYGQRGVFLVGAGFSLVGAFVTLVCIPKVSRQSLTFFVERIAYKSLLLSQMSGDLEDEDYRFQRILEENGLARIGQDLEEITNSSSMDEK